MVQHRLPDSREAPQGVRSSGRSPGGVVLEPDHLRDLRGGQVVRVARLARVDDAVTALEGRDHVARQGRRARSRAVSSRGE